MVINVRQTHGNFTQQFEVYYNKEYKFSAKLGSFSKYQPITMANEIKGIQFTASYEASSIRSHIPFGYLFGGAVEKNIYNCQKNGKQLCRFSKLAISYGKQHYVISLGKTTSLQAYFLGLGGSFICIYDNDTQIAIIECSERTTDNCDNYLIYLLEEYSEYADMLSLFTVYFDNLNNTSRGSAHIGEKTTYTYTPFSPYKNKYDPDWVKNNREAIYPPEND